MFEDTEFSPGAHVLGSSSCEYVQKMLSKVTWRLIDTTDPEFALFDHIGPFDFTQGLSTNLGLLSALISLSYTPSRIERIFFNRDLKSTTEYTLQIYVKGVPTKFKLDLYFPFISSDFAFIRPCSKINMTSLWPVFLEKLWAKRSGSYFSPSKTAHVTSILSELTGAPNEIVFSCSQNLGNKLTKSLGSQFTIIAIPKPQEFNLKTVSINPLFAYTVADFQTSGILLKNPLGFSPLPGQLTTNSQDSGVLVDFSTFSEKFDYISILHYHDNFKYSYKSSNKNCFQVSIHTNGLSYFSVFQQSGEDVPLRIIVASDQGYIKGKSAMGSSIWVEVECVPGTYYIYTEKSSSQVFSVYSQMNAGIEEIEEIGFFSNNITVSSIKNKPQVHLVQVCPGITVYCLEKLGVFDDDCMEGYVYNVVENELKDSFAVIEIEAEYENFEVSGKMEFIVQPGSSQLVYFKQKVLTQDTFFNSKIRAKLVPVSVS